MTSITGIRTTIREEDFFVFDAKSSQDSSYIFEIQDTSETVTNKRFQFDTHLVSFEVMSPGNTRFASGNGTAYSIILQLGLRRYSSFSTEAIVVKKGISNLVEYQPSPGQESLGLWREEPGLSLDVQFPIPQQNEDDIWYDRLDYIVFNCSKSLTWTVKSGIRYGGWVLGRCTNMSSTHRIRSCMVGRNRRMIINVSGQRTLGRGRDGLRKTFQMINRKN